MALNTAHTMMDFPTGGQNVLAFLKKCPNAHVVINRIIESICGGNCVFGYI